MALTQNNNSGSLLLEKQDKIKRLAKQITLASETNGFRCPIYTSHNLAKNNAMQLWKLRICMDYVSVLTMMLLIIWSLD